MPLTSPRPTLYPDRALLSRRHAPQLNARPNSNRWMKNIRYRCWVIIHCSRSSPSNFTHTKEEF
jgi:hypothetical protein